ncbi:MAG: hypothetical protein GXX91_13710 [Verrucomicrobiaceae bacterium]|nr:hypothetical protein [Verrucomicrobiaceae bacterium]
MTTKHQRSLPTTGGSLLRKRRIGLLAALAGVLGLAGTPGAGEDGESSAGESAPSEPPPVAEVGIEAIDYGATPMTTVPDGIVKTFRIPAPRSRIVSADGVTLARNRVGKRLVLPLAKSAVSADAAVALVAGLRSRFDESVPLFSLDEADVRKHYEHRPWIPLAISPTLSAESVAALGGGLPEGVSVQEVSVREYPEGELTAHLIGYTGVSLPDQHGPVARVEYAWPPTEGRAGMETILDEQIRGSDGEVLRLYDADGDLRHQEIVRKPTAGNTLVLSIHLGMQRLAREQLERSGRPGAFVAVDADTGDILAMVSHPTFDPNLFEGGISAETFASLAEGKDAPLFDRAVAGAYPPGSTFKPFVALAGMEAGEIHGTNTLYPGPPGLTIDGRYFKNWSSDSFGPMDVCYALVTSCNTWFYQAALNTGAGPIADVSTRFGLGTAPLLPLPSVAAGNIPNPESYGDPRSLANFAIGQGQVLTSPVQMALAMAALANGEFVPQPRLVRETVDPRLGTLILRNPPRKASLLRLRPEDINLIRDGMWGVVNYSGGTAGRAAMRNPVVYGKTGTSQWSVGGRMRSLAWFTGWVDAKNPRIAFAVVTQGKGSETLSGGRSAAPIAAGFLRRIYGETETYAVTLPKAPSRDRPAIIAAAIIPPVEEPVEIEPRRRGGLLRFLFGGGRRTF